MDDTSEATTVTVSDISEAKERASGGSSGDYIHVELFETHQKLKETVQLLQLLVSDDYDDDNGDGKENKYLGDEINAINGKVSNSEKHRDDEKKENVYDEITNELKSITQTNVEKITDPKEGSKQAEKKEKLDQEISEDQIKNMSKREDSENEVKDDCDDNSNGKDKTECNSKRKSQIKQIDSSAIANDNTTEEKVLPSDSGKQESEKRKDPIIESDSEYFQSVKSDSNDEGNSSTNNILKRKRNVSGSSSSGISVDKTLKKKRTSNTFSKNAIVSLSRCAVPNNVPVNTSKMENSDSEDNDSDKGVKIRRKKAVVRRKKAVVRKKTKESNSDSNDDEFPTKERVKRKKDSDSDYEPKRYSKSNKKAKGSDTESESKDSDSENKNDVPGAAKLKKRILTARNKNRSSNSDFEDDSLKPMDKILDGKLKKNRNEYEDKRPKCQKDSDSDSEDESRKTSKQVSNLEIPCKKNLRRKLIKEGATSDSESENESKKREKVSGRISNRLRGKNSRTKIEKEVHIESVSHSNSTSKSSGSSDSSSDSDDDAKDKLSNKRGGNKKKTSKSSDTSSSDEESEKAKKTKYCPDYGKRITRLRRYLHIAGIHVNNYDMLWKDCHSNKAKSEALVKLLKKEGLHGTPTIENCKRLREERTIKKQVKDLDTKNITETTGIPTETQLKSENDVTSDNSVKCPFCKEFFKAKGLVIHIAKIHGSTARQMIVDQQDSCSSVEEGGNSLHSIPIETQLKSENDVTSDNSVKCPFCKEFFKAKGLVIHIAKIHGSTARQTIVDQQDSCSSVEEGGNSLHSIPIETQLKSENDVTSDNSVKCPFCKEFFKAKGLVIHITKIHGSTARQTIADQDSSISVKEGGNALHSIPTETQLNSENDVTSDNNSVKCPFCKEFFKPKGLLIHITKIHGSTARQTIADQDSSISVKEDGNALHSTLTVRRNSIEELDETPLSSRMTRFQGNTHSIQLPETEETKNLTNSELKRLVLLEHLKLLRMQQQKLSA